VFHLRVLCGRVASPAWRFSLAVLTGCLRNYSCTNIDAVLINL